jgi:hypothetical protein
MPAIGHCAGSASRTSDAAKGTPPLIFHGGSVMMTPSSSPVVVTPIFWNPTGHPMAAAYKTVITNYLNAVAAASGQTSNVFSVANEYSGNNGQIHYNVRVGASINDTRGLPASGCTVARNDRTGIYADNTGYNACLDDAQLQSQISTATSGLAHNLSHMYVLFLPKQVESGFTCGTEANFGVVESPNGNPDADVEISPTSHEINESITDPDTSTGWFDSSGFENGDECAFVFGATSGTAGHLFNQTINGFHFLTQEEFSNKDFAITHGGCVQSSSAEA